MLPYPASGNPTAGLGLRRSPNRGVSPILSAPRKKVPLRVPICGAERGIRALSGRARKTAGVRGFVGGRILRPAQAEPACLPSNPSFSAQKYPAERQKPLGGIWRRERDSNPRTCSHVTRFRVVRVRPLRHLCTAIRFYNISRQISSIFMPFERNILQKNYYVCMVGFNCRNKSIIRFCALPKYVYPSRGQICRTTAVS